MATRFVDKVSSEDQILNYPDAAGISLDTTDGVLKYHDGSSVVDVAATTGTGVTGTVVLAAVTELIFENGVLVGTTPV